MTARRLLPGPHCLRACARLPGEALADAKPRDGSGAARRAQPYVARTRSGGALAVVRRPGARSPLPGDLDPERCEARPAPADSAA